MANPANVMKMLQALGGGMASESYGTGSPMRGGQPILPKPMISRANLLSPYAPGNNNGQTPNYFGNVPYDATTSTRNPMNPTGVNEFNPTVVSGGQPNSGHGLKPSKMGDSDSHTANQLARYLVTNGKSFRTDPGAHIRGMSAGASYRDAQ